MTSEPSTGSAQGAGYVCFQSPEGEEWAAVLVVSRGGLPLEFLYAGPLRPTPVQEILYQDRLQNEARATLLRALLQGLRSRVVFLVGPASEARALLGGGWKGPCLAVEEGALTWLTEPDGDLVRFVADLDAAVGAAEPLGRAAAALAYVVEYERQQGGEAGR